MTCLTSTSSLPSGFPRRPGTLPGLGGAAQPWQAPSSHVLDRAQTPPEREVHARGAPPPAPALLERFTCLHLPSPSHAVGITSPQGQRTGFPSGSEGKESACNAGDPGSVLGRSPGGGHGNPLQYSGLENPMDRGAWQATVHRVTKSRTRLSDAHFHVARVNLSERDRAACPGPGQLPALRVSSSRRSRAPGGRGPGGAEGALPSPHVELLQHVVGLERLRHCGGSGIPTAIVRDVQDPQEDVCLGHKGATP